MPGERASRSGSGQEAQTREISGQGALVTPRRLSDGARSAGTLVARGGVVRGPRGGSQLGVGGLLPHRTVSCLGVKRKGLLASAPGTAARQRSLLSVAVLFSRGQPRVAVCTRPGFTSSCASTGLLEGSNGYVSSLPAGRGPAVYTAGDGWIDCLKVGDGAIR